MGPAQICITEHVKFITAPLRTRSVTVTGWGTVRGRLVYSLGTVIVKLGDSQNKLGNCLRTVKYSKMVR